MTDKERQYARAAMKIGSARSELSSSDYKIIKCYEAQLMGGQMPYDLPKLVAEREALRAQIRQLEVVLASGGK
jgi:hypothetical protein